ncbi:MAG TPA: PEP-CTERM sorting domain-containing protein, partial [Candidatus Limnocylindria bacterium]|nr:PEP-CTERM sorting domain-containing protein [Candidatus Limnocylindria bacterium]
SLSSGGESAGEGNYYVTKDPNNTHSGFSSFGDHTTGSGNMMVINGSTVASKTVWQETVSVTAGRNWTFSLWMASAVAGSPAVLQVYINNVLQSTTFTAPSSAATWQQFSLNWSSTGTTSATIRLVDSNTAAGGNDFAIDDIRLVPEPSTYAAGMFLAGAGFFAWRRQRKATAIKSASASPAA